jgi:radical SAM superfamily enzyme YgiQ (UPF0313 family)
MRVALGFANRAELALSNLGYRITETLLAATPGLAVERVFLPHGGLPVPAGSVRTQPSQLALTDVDLVLLSLSFEGDFAHVPALLAAGGLPASADQRLRGHPLVVAGGAAVMINPEPLSAFVDLFLVGESEALLAPFLERWRGELGAERTERIASLAQLPGALAPLMRRHRFWALDRGGLREGAAASVRGESSAFSSRPEGEADAHVETIKWVEAAAHTSCARLPAGGAFGESLLLELGRGCPRRCRFCVATRIYAPLRQRSGDGLRDAALQESAPGEAVGLLSLSAGDHPELPALARELCAQGRRVSVSSLPATFSRRDAVQALLASGTTTLTIAPETGSDRLRALAGKPLTNDAILRSVTALGEEGLPRLRTYFMIGLPFEREEDLRALLEFLGEMRRRLPPATRLSATVNTFVPKPRTPFQWAPVAAARYLSDAARRLQRDAPKGVQLRVKSAREARQHAALTRGDAAWGDRLLRMARSGVTLAAALRAEGLRTDDLTGAVDPNARFPWQYLMSEAELAELAREWNRAQTEAARA